MPEALPGFVLSSEVSSSNEREKQSDHAKIFLCVYLAAARAFMFKLGCFVRYVLCKHFFLIFLQSQSFHGNLRQIILLRAIDGCCDASSYMTVCVWHTAQESRRTVDLEIFSFNQKTKLHQNTLTLLSWFKSKFYVKKKKKGKSPSLCVPQKL